jgi:hypothetical protein
MEVCDSAERMSRCAVLVAVSLLALIPACGSDRGDDNKALSKHEQKA